MECGGKSISRSDFKIFIIPLLTFILYRAQFVMSTNQNNKYIKSTDPDEKRYLLLKKPNSYSLSKYKLVHSREQDIVDTLIVRNTWSKANLNKFSVKGIVLIQNIFYGMLTLLCEHEDEILSTLKYDNTNELVVLLESLNENDI